MQADPRQEALEEIADGTTPDRFGKYEYLRDWVHKTAVAALAAQPVEQGLDVREAAQALSDRLGYLYNRRIDLEYPWEAEWKALAACLARVASE